MDGVRVDTHDRRLRATSGVVFQDPSLDDHLTAHQNLILGARSLELPVRKRRIGLRNSSSLWS